MSTLAANGTSRGVDQGKGFAVSILVHFLIVVGAISATSKIETAPKLMVVDFTIIERPVKIKPTQPTKPVIDVAVPPVIKPPKEIKVEALPKKILRKKVIPKTPKIIPVKKIKIATIKEERVPEIQPEPVPESLPEQIIAAERPPFEPIIEELAPLLAQNISAPPIDVEPMLQTLPVFPAPSAGKSRPDDDQTRVSKYTKAQFSQIQQGIQQGIRYPRTARRMGWEGKVVVEFIICKDGTVKNLHIVESSGFKALDKNAVVTIKKAAPFPVPPIPAKIIIPVVYLLS